MKKVILSGMILLGCTLNSFAADPTPSVAAMPTSNADSTSQAFAIAKGSPLTVKLIDYCWANREDLANQKIIADYLNTQPDLPYDYETAWKTARLVYFIGNYGIGEKEFVSSSAGVKIFNYGVKAGKIAIAQKPNGVEGQYWYAVDLGSYGLAKGILASASNAKDGMAALRQAIAIDPSYQWYGSSRILGRYYQELPGLFGGSYDKAIELLKTATDKAPQFRNNWVFLGQYYLKTRDYQNALTACQKALSLPNQDGKYEEMRYSREANECITTAKAKLGS